MQISTRDGITCDQCGTTHKTDFDYYSYDFRKVLLFGGIKPSLQSILSQEMNFSLDICPQCWDQFKINIVDQYARIMTSNTKARGKSPKLICEVTGRQIKDNSYYYCTVVFVKVLMSGQPNICSNCEHKTYDNDKPCVRCNNNNFVKLAMTKTEERVLEFNICNEEYQMMVNKAENVRNLTNEWQTSSDTNN